MNWLFSNIQHCKFRMNDTAVWVLSVDHLATDALQTAMVDMGGIVGMAKYIVIYHFVVPCFPCVTIYVA